MVCVVIFYAPFVHEMFLLFQEAVIFEITGVASKNFQISYSQWN